MAVLGLPAFFWRYVVFRWVVSSRVVSIMTGHPIPVSTDVRRAACRLPVARIFPRAAFVSSRFLQPNPANFYHWYIVISCKNLSGLELPGIVYFGWAD
jgi:hypothetical protein